MNEEFARKELADLCKRLYDRNLTVSAGGNMSLRLNKTEFLITPSGRNKGSLLPEDLIKMDLKGNILSEGKPSIEREFHIAIYKDNPETNAVVHCHPLYCTALAVREENVRSGLTPEGVILLGEVPMVDYFTPGSKELAKAVKAHSGSKAMLMKRHGAITQGRTSEEAFNRMEELEFQAKLQMLVDGAEELPLQEIDKLKRL
jgi:Ribulose-5-phosphate 4-epimerase and related epimerases and aldolases